MKLKTFWHYLKPWWVSEEKVTAWSGLFILLVLACISVYAAWLNNVWTKHFFISFENKDANGFLYLIALYIPLVLIIGLEGCTREYLSGWLSFRWRRWITKNTQEQWLTNKLYYKTASSGGIDNPDQRISQDIAQSCNKIIELFHIFFRDGLNCVVFASNLWIVSTNLQFYFPGFLVWIALLYSFVGFIITATIGKRLVSLDRQNEELEAHFRYQLVRLLERREEVAMLNGELFENFQLADTFKTLGTNYYQVLSRKFYVTVFNALHYNGRFFVSLAILGPRYFAGLSTLALIMQARGMFNQVSIAAATLMNKFTELSSLVASLQRLTNFDQAMHAARHNHNYLPIKQVKESAEVAQPMLKIERLDILHPNGRLMWAVPSIQLLPGMRKTLMAPSGTGKTTLLRVITGLYQFHRVQDPHNLIIPTNLEVIPQRPYMPIGSLRECLSYPHADFNDEIIVKAMEQCYLSHLIPLLNQKDDYQQILSLGEQQRINFVRVLLHKPQWLLLDEPTSQLNVDYIEHLCAILVQELPETAILAISHYPLPFFEQIN